MIIFGRKVDTVVVENGRRETRPCEVCGKRTLFEEVRIQHTATLYFTAVAAYKSENLLRCSVCGNGFEVRDREETFADRQRGTLAGWVAHNAHQAASAVADALPDDLRPSEDPHRPSEHDASKRSPEWTRAVEELERRIGDAEIRDLVWAKRRAEHPGPVRSLARIDTPTDGDWACMRHVLGRLRQRTL